MKRMFVVSLILIFMVSALPISLFAQEQTFGEAPMLAERVAGGELPPVEERLPANPRVIDLPSSEIGTYGGDFRDPFVGDAFWASQMVFWTFWKGLVNWNETYT